jgi:sugar lactone lactonase YvrE
VPNIHADISYPMYIDKMPDGTLIQSNFGNNLLLRIDPGKMQAKLFSDGSAIGMKNVGNCVVDDEGCVWVNEVEGCRVRRFDSKGKLILTLGDGKPGFQPDVADFEKVRFNWIYDIRRGPDDNIYVLDSKNFSVRMIDRKNRRVINLAGTGAAGYEGDGGDARSATFGSDPNAKFDGPISMSLDEEGNIFVGDRFNHVVRMIHRKTGIIQTIAGNQKSVDEKRNEPELRDPLKLNLPKISSMDYYDGRLFIPTDLTDNLGDLIVLRKTR